MKNSALPQAKMLLAFLRGCGKREKGPEKIFVGFSV
jgi:hypothetical protein